MAFSKIIHAKPTAEIQRFMRGYCVEGSCKVELALRSDDLGSYTDVTLRVGQSFRFEVLNSHLVGIAAFRDRFSSKTYHIPERRTVPTGIELGDINEENTQFSIKLRHKQSFRFFIDHLDLFFNAVPFYLLLEKFLLANDLTCQIIDRDAAMYGSEKAVRGGDAEGKISENSSLLCPATPPRKYSEHEAKGSPQSCPLVRTKEFPFLFDDVKRPGTA